MLCALALLLAMAVPARAQMYVGAQIGMANGKFNGDSPPGFIYKGKLFPMAGLAFDFKLKDDVFISVNPSYFSGGTALQYPYTNEEGEKMYKDSIDLHIRFVTLPVSLKIISDNNKFEFSGGFQVAFPTKATANDGLQETDIYDNLKSATLNMTFSIGYRIPIAKNLLVIALMYGQGLTNLANEFNTIGPEFSRIRTSFFRLSTAWYFPVGKKINKSK